MEQLYTFSIVISLIMWLYVGYKEGEWVDSVICATFVGFCKGILFCLLGPFSIWLAIRSLNKFNSIKNPLDNAVDEALIEYDLCVEKANQRQDLRELIDNRNQDLINEAINLKELEQGKGIY